MNGILPLIRRYHNFSQIILIILNTKKITSHRQRTSIRPIPTIDEKNLCLRFNKKSYLWRNNTKNGRSNK